MATDMFLKLGDIKGESRDQVHRDEIDITEWNWGMSQSGSMHTGTGGGAGKVNMDNLMITKRMDKSSPNLMMACSTGKHYPEARLVVRKAGGSSAVEYLVITLKEVMVVSYSTSAESKDDLLYDRIALNFATVDVSYQPQKADGGKDGGASEVRLEYPREHQNVTECGSGLAPTFNLHCSNYLALSSRPRSTRLGIAIAAAKPSNDTPALTISKCRNVISNSPRNASCAGPGAAFKPSSSTFPELPSATSAPLARCAKLESCNNANNSADMHATPTAPPRERNRLVVLVATPMSRCSTEFCVPTREVGNCIPAAIPQSNMNRLVTATAWGALRAMPRIAIGLSKAPIKIIGL